METFVRRANRIILGLGIAAAMTMPLMAQAGSTSQAQPANKATASGRKQVVFAPGQRVELLSATLKTSKPEDLILQVSAECSILTSLLTNNSSNTATSAGEVRVWVEVDNKIVPIQDISSPPQDPSQQRAGDETDKATFCNRVYQRTVTDQESPADGIDQESDYIRTKSANAFNWLRLNVGSGIHTVRVLADLTATPACANPTGDVSNTTCAQAYVGNRTLIIEPTKLANNAVIS